MVNECNIDVERDTNIHLENRKVSRIFFWFLWAAYAVVYMAKNCYNGSLASIVSEGILTKSQTGFITAMFSLYTLRFRLWVVCFQIDIAPSAC